MRNWICYTWMGLTAAWMLLCLMSWSMCRRWKRLAMHFQKAAKDLRGLERQHLPLQFMTVEERERLARYLADAQQSQPDWYVLKDPE